ncbi:MAG: helix-turn-helix domain-containing protein, partial [Myxococcota bacterium]
ARDLASASGPLRADEGRALIFAGMSYSALGDTRAVDQHYIQAHRAYEQALRIFNALGATRFLIAIHTNIGNLYARKEQRIQQRYHHEQALAIARRVNHRLLHAAVLASLALLSVQEGLHEEARALLDESLGVQRQVGRRDAEAAVLAYQGLLEADQGHWSEAMVCFLDALEVCEAAGLDRLTSELLLQSSMITLVAGHARDALPQVERAYTLFVQVHDDSRATLSRVVRLVCAAHLGDRDRVRTEMAFLNTAPAPRHRPDAAAQAELLLQAAERISPAIADLLNERPTWATPEALAQTPSTVLLRILSTLSQEHRPRPSPPPALLTDEGLGDGELLTADRALTWIQAPGQEGPVDLSRKRVVRRLLSKLLEAREQEPGEPVRAEALLKAGWPQQSFVGDSGRSRLYVAIASLRELGLADVLLTRSGGYLLDPRLPLYWADDG